MRHARSLLVLSAALLSLALTEPAFASHGCAGSARGARVVTQTRDAIVFVKRQRVYGCLDSVGSTRRLPGLDPVGTEPGDAGALFTLSGAFVAFERFFVEPAGAETHSRVIVFNLRNGQTPVNDPATSIVPTAEDSVVESLEVKRNGSVAWIGRRSGGPTAVYEVHRRSLAPSAPGNVVLDEDGDIGPRSLGLSADRRTIFWLNGADPRSGTLP